MQSTLLGPVNNKCRSAMEEIKEELELRKQEKINNAEACYKYSHEKAIYSDREFTSVVGIIANKFSIAFTFL